MKVVLPPRNPGEQPTLVFHKQAHRILRMRQKKNERALKLEAKGLVKMKGIKKKYDSRVKVAERRERLPNGTFKPKIE